MIAKLFRKIFKLLGLFSYDLCYFENDLSTTESKDYICSDIKLIIRETTSEDMSIILTLSDKVVRERLKKYLTRRSTCFVACHYDKIAGYVWVNDQSLIINGEILTKLGPGGVCFLGGFVFPEYRMKKVFQELVSACRLEMKRRGFKFTCSFTALDNQLALAAREKFMSPKQKMKVWSIFGKLLIFNSVVGQGNLLDY